jgi:sugar phosphate isomerase/epimerase
MKERYHKKELAGRIARIPGACPPPRIAPSGAKGYLSAKGGIMGIPIALQLYTVRDDLARDFVGTLGKVAEMGYAGVEFFSHDGLSAGRLKGHLERLALMPVGSHVSIEQLEKDLDGIIAFAREIGNPYVVCSQAPLLDLPSVKKFAALFNSYGERIQNAGLEFCYHNHSHELALIDGERVLDLLFRETDPSLVEMELDTGWVSAAGADPAAYLRAYAGRCPLVHVKDMKAGEGSRFTEVGSGTVDVRGVVRQAEVSGVEWLIVEQDSSEGSPLESARISLENMKRMGLA